MFLQLCALFKSSALLFAADRSYLKGYCFHLKIDTGMNTKETIAKKSVRKKEGQNERKKQREKRKADFIKRKKERETISKHTKGSK